jgi:hypothetical protein
MARVSRRHPLPLLRRRVILPSVQLDRQHFLFVRDIEPVQLTVDFHDDLPRGVIEPGNVEDIGVSPELEFALASGSDLTHEFAHRRPIANPPHFLGTADQTVRIEEFAPAPFDDRRSPLPFA